MSTSAKVIPKWFHLPSTNRQLHGCNSPHDRLMSLAMDVYIVIFGAENGTNGCHSSVPYAYFIPYAYGCPIYAYVGRLRRYSTRKRPDKKVAAA